MVQLPSYISKKLHQIAISEEQIVNLGYLQCFARLKAEFPSITYIILQELYQYCTGDRNPSKDKIKNIIKQYHDLPPVFSSIPEPQHQYFMNEAYNTARNAVTQAEIPIGAVLIKNGEIIARAHNQTIHNCAIMAHAEILAIQQANQVTANYRLNDCDLYVTLEPCLMCAGAIIESRIKRLIFGCYRSNEMGAVARGIFAKRKYNHHCQVIYLENQNCKNILTDNFYKLRQKTPSKIIKG